MSIHSTASSLFARSIWAWARSLSLDSSADASIQARHMHYDVHIEPLRGMKPLLAGISVLSQHSRILLSLPLLERAR
jgi:hypothetical protein